MPICLPRTYLEIGFTITMYEFEATISTLWATVKGKLPYAYPDLFYTKSTKSI